MVIGEDIARKTIKTASPMNKSSMHISTQQLAIDSERDMIVIEKGIKGEA